MAAAGRRWARAAGPVAEFEQEMLFGRVIDALDDHVEVSRPGLAERLDAETCAPLA